jgi:hypothetical protein
VTRRRKKNPRRRRRNHARKRRHNPGMAAPRRRHRRRSNPGRRHHARRRNPSRRRRRNPDWTGAVKSTAIAVLAGIGVGLAGTVLVNGAMKTSSPTVKSVALVVLAGGAAIALEHNPALAAGIATGLLLVPGQALLSSVLPPSLVGQTAAAQLPGAPGSTVAGPPNPPGTAGLGYLNRSGFAPRRMGMLHGRGMAGLSDTQDMLGVRRAS